jgi:hypothetical protein
MTSSNETPHATTHKQTCKHSNRGPVNGMWHRNGFWWEISRFTAVRHRLTLRAFLQIKDESGTVVAFTRHHVGIDLVSGCFGIKKLAFLNRKMWCSKPRMCCKTKQFHFYYRPFSIFFSFLLQHQLIYFPFYYRPFSIFFSFLLQHQLIYFPFYYSTQFYVKRQLSTYLLK